MMAKAWNQTRVSEILGIEYPIIQGPRGGLSSQRLTAAVSNFGGLGSFGAHGLEPNEIEDAIAETGSLTAKPFSTNPWVSMEDAEVRNSDAGAFCRALSLALWAGQSANLARCPGMTELLQSLVDGAAERLNRI
jgi:nitronate monooxygenase